MYVKVFYNLAFVAKASAEPSSLLIGQYEIMALQYFLHPETYSGYTKNLWHFLLSRAPPSWICNFDENHKYYMHNIVSVYFGNTF